MAGGLLIFLIFGCAISWLSFRLNLLLKFSGVNQHTYLFFTLFYFLQCGMLVSLKPSEWQTAIIRPGISIAFLFVLIVLDGKKRYFAETCLIVCAGIYMLVHVPLYLMKDGFTTITIITAASRIIIVIVLWVVLSHPYDVLRRAVKINKLKT